MTPNCKVVQVIVKSIRYFIWFSEKKIQATAACVWSETERAAA
jgi:hypothetical protein